MQAFPKQITVAKLLDSRYPAGIKPQSWDARKAGIDTIVTDKSQTIKLLSDGAQSPPKPGWSIMLTAGDETKGYLWSLYGLGSASS